MCGRRPGQHASAPVRSPIRPSRRARPPTPSPPPTQVTPTSRSSATATAPDRPHGDQGHAADDHLEHADRHHLRHGPQRDPTERDRHPPGYLRLQPSFRRRSDGRQPDAGRHVQPDRLDRLQLGDRERDPDGQQGQLGRHGLRDPDDRGLRPRGLVGLHRDRRDRQPRGPALDRQRHRQRRDRPHVSPPSPRRAPAAPVPARSAPRPWSRAAVRGHGHLRRRRRRLGGDHRHGPDRPHGDQGHLDRHGLRDPDDRGPTATRPRRSSR